jgi:signal transduction histidine kinase
MTEEHVLSLEVLEQLKDEFISTASHELKHPLTSLRGYSQLLLRELRRPSPNMELLARGLAEIDAQTGAMSNLLDSLLDASRIQSGMLRIWPEFCSLADCLNGMVSHLNPEERERLDITFPTAPLSGNWEQSKIEEVFANLVHNALKYSPPEKQIRVTARQTVEGAEVAVQDWGLGISTDDLPHLFERFYRSRRAEASGLPGTGLGLYISRGIIAAHGGRLWAESAGEGHGATFRFTLPNDPAAGGKDTSSELLTGSGGNDDRRTR